jgi:hypothetical protein
VGSIDRHDGNSEEMTMRILGMMALLLLAGSLCIVGCRIGRGVDLPPYVVSIHLDLSMDSDTLYALPNDTVYCTGWAEVKSNSGTPEPGMTVSLLHTADWGFFEYADTTKRDTTNDLGRVNFRFGACNHYGANTIIARVDNVQDTWPLVVLERQAARLRIVVADTSLPFHVLDPICFSVSLRDSADSPMPGVSVQVTCNNQMFFFGQQPLVTDSNGIVTACGSTQVARTFVLYAEALGLQDSTHVTVLPGPGSLTTLDVDNPNPVSYSPTDTVHVNGIVSVSDGCGNPTPDTRYRYIIERPWGHFEFTGSDPEDPMIATGQSQFHFWSVGDTNTYQEVRVCMIDRPTECLGMHLQFSRCGPGAHLRLVVSPDTVRIWHVVWEARTSVTAIVEDSNGVGTGGILVDFHGEFLSADRGRTNSEGRCAITWEPREFGRSLITATAGPFTAEGSVVVIDTSGRRK